MDLTASLERDEYRDLLDTWQRRVHRLSGKAWREGVSPVLVFEGWDAGGKGGAIRRITQALPARGYRVVSIAAPTDEEKAHHYLWRFWRKLPRAGQMVVFDRSWYGRVLVERVEGFTPEWRWRQGYDEINDFEEQLVEHGWPVREVLAPPLPRGAAAALPGPGGDAVQEVQDHRRGLPEPREVAGVRRRPSTRWSRERVRRSRPGT